MQIDMALLEKIKTQILEEGRSEKRYHPVSLPQVLIERFQEAADAENEGDFSSFLEMVLRLYLADPRSFPVCWVKVAEGASKNKPVSLSSEIIKEIKEEANMMTGGVFARLVQIVVRGYLVERGYLTIPR